MGIHFLSDTVHSPLMCGINFYVVFFSYRAVRGPVGGFAHFRLKIFRGGGVVVLIVVPSTLIPPSPPPPVLRMMRSLRKAFMKPWKNPGKGAEIVFCVFL